MKGGWGERTGTKEREGLTFEEEGRIDTWSNKQKEGKAEWDEGRVGLKDRNVEKNRHEQTN